jgi:hypothetical protein
MLHDFPIAMRQTLSITNAKRHQVFCVHWNQHRAASSAMFSQIKLLCFGETPLPSDQKYNILATAKLRIRQSCTKLCRVETWILCFPSKTKKKSKNLFFH